MSQSHENGLIGEEKACKYLEANKYAVIERNFRSHHGEVDIIAQKDGNIVFVEVKNYSYKCYYKPVYSISKSKKQCLIYAATYYLSSRKIKEVNCRFDVITIYRDQAGEEQIEHYENAFDKD